MTESIVAIVAAVFGYLAARGVDAIVGKWVAWILIAWEQKATEASKKAFDEAMRALKDKSPEKAKAWDDWRKRAANASTGT